MTAIQEREGAISCMRPCDVGNQRILLLIGRDDSSLDRQALR